MVLNELVERLTNLYGDADPVEFQINESIPLNELFQAVEEHANIRTEIEGVKKDLEDRTYQFRAIQKKLLTRFKDKNPTSLNNLDFLLEDTYYRIINQANRVQDLKKMLVHASQRLSATVHIILFLIKVRLKLNDNEL